MPPPLRAVDADESPSDSPIRLTYHDVTSADGTRLRAWTNDPDRALPGLALAGDHRRATRAQYEARNPHLEGDMP